MIHLERPAPERLFSEKELNDAFLIQLRRNGLVREFNALVECGDTAAARLKDVEVEAVDQEIAALPEGLMDAAMAPFRAPAQPFRACCQTCGKPIDD